MRQAQAALDIFVFEGSEIQAPKGTGRDFLGGDFRSKMGLPVLNIPGCPAHPDWVTQILVAVATWRAGGLSIDDLHRPATFCKTFTQTGCTLDRRR